jgi:hypothetical protein
MTNTKTNAKSEIASTRFARINLDPDSVREFIDWLCGMEQMTDCDQTSSGRDGSRRRIPAQKEDRQIGQGDWGECWWLPLEHTELFFPISDRSFSPFEECVRQSRSGHRKRHRRQTEFKREA